jgi:hypothetical protein
VNSVSGGRRLALAALAVIVLVPITVVVALHRTPAAPNPPGATIPASPPAATTPFLSTTSSPAATLPIDPSVGLTLHDADTLLGQLVQKGVEPYSDPKYWYECPARAVFPTPMSCPVTSRLVSQLHACCAGGPPILRERFFTGPPVLISVRHVPAGADAHATAFVTFTIAIGIGSGTSEYDLAVVKAGNRWLVDDVSCTRYPLTSSDYYPGGPQPSHCY